MKISLGYNYFCFQILKKSEKKTPKKRRKKKNDVEIELK